MNSVTVSTSPPSELRGRSTEYSQSWQSEGDHGGINNASITPSNSSFFQKKIMKRIKAFALSSTIGAEITAPAVGRLWALCYFTHRNLYARVEHIGIKTATIAPQQKTVASSQSGSAS